MEAPPNPPASHHCATLFKANVDAIVQLIGPRGWDRLTEEQHSNILHTVKAIAETSYKLSEVALVEALSRHAAAQPGEGAELCGESWVAKSTSEEIAAASESALAEAKMLRSEVERVAKTSEGIATASESALAEAKMLRSEVERVALGFDEVKAEMTRMAAETKKIKAETERIARYL